MLDDMYENSQARKSNKHDDVVASEPEIAGLAGDFVGRSGCPRFTMLGAQDRNTFIDMCSFCYSYCSYESFGLMNGMSTSSYVSLVD